MSSSFSSPIETPIGEKSFERVQYEGDNLENGSAGDGGVLNSRSLQEPIGFPYYPYYTHDNCSIQREPFPSELLGTNLCPFFTPVRVERFPDLPPDIRLSARACSPFSPYDMHPPVWSAPHYMAAVPYPCGFDYFGSQVPAFYDMARHENNVRQPTYHTLGIRAYALSRPELESYYPGTYDLRFRQEIVFASPETTFQASRFLGRSMSPGPEPSIHFGSDENSETTAEATTSSASTQQLQFDRGSSFVDETAESPSPTASRCGSPLVVQMADSPSPSASCCKEAPTKPIGKTSTGGRKNTKLMRKKEPSKRGRKKSKLPGYKALEERLKEKGIVRPKKALTPYNIFYKDERAAILKAIAEKKGKLKDDETEWSKRMRTVTDGRCNTSASACDDSERRVLAPSVGETTSEEIKISRRKEPHKMMGFGDMTKTISERWKTVDPERLADCIRRSMHEDLRYKAECALYMEKRRDALDAILEELESSVSPEARKRYLESFAAEGDAKPSGHLSEADT